MAQIPSSDTNALTESLRQAAERARMVREKVSAEAASRQSGGFDAVERLLSQRDTELPKRQP